MPFVSEEYIATILSLPPAFLVSCFTSSSALKNEAMRSPKRQSAFTGLPQHAISEDLQDYVFQS